MIIGEEISVLSPPKTSLGHLRVVKQIKVVALRTEEEVNRSWGLSVYLMDISRIFYVSKQTKCDAFIKTVLLFKSKNDRDT